MADDNSVFKAVEDNPTVTPIEDNPVVDWIGEGKKYKTEQEALASVPAAQGHISKIEQENLDLRTKLEELQTSGKSIDTVLEALQQREQPQASPTEGIDEGTLITKINQVVDSRSQAERDQINLSQANDLAVKQFGDKATQTVQDKAIELGLSVDYLANVAKQSPSAFAKLIGIEGNGSQTELPRGVASTGSVVNTQTLDNDSSLKNMAYYNNMRKESPEQFNALATQQEMMRSRSALGAKFFNK